MTKCVIGEFEFTPAAVFEKDRGNGTAKRIDRVKRTVAPDCRILNISIAGLPFSA